MKKIAVIGAGIAGNSAAWALSRHHHVTLFEKDFRPGGHSATEEVSFGDKRIAVDTGFIVYNDHNYPLLTRLFEHLGVETQESNMSFGVSLNDGEMEWSGQGLRAVFAQRRNIFSPGFLYMLREIFQFNRICKDDLASGALCGATFGEYLSQRRFSDRLRDDYLVPMTAAIWSSAPSAMLDFPAESLVRFMDNHRLLHRKHERPKWRTVKGGSREYVRKLLADFRGTLRLGNEIASVEGTGNGVRIHLAGGAVENFDAVVMASHSDQSLEMLANPRQEQRDVLAAIPYKANTVYLHSDEKLMPRRKAAWSAWNYIGSRSTDGSTDLSVTYWMNRLQNLDPACPLFVSLNPAAAPDPAKTHGRYIYDHPQFSAKALEAQRRLPSIQGLGNIYFCGAWTRYGFHEDGLSSGLEVARLLGASAPWSEEAALHPVEIQTGSGFDPAQRLEAAE